MSTKSDNTCVARHVIRALALALVSVVVVACGGGSGGDENSRPTRSGVLPSPTRTEDLLPSPTDSIEVPTRSDDTGAIETRTGGVLPTVTQTVTPPPSSTADESSSSPEAAESEDSGGAPSWVWWALGALVLALAISIPMLMRQRRRRAWRDDLAGAEEEVAWFARVLVPSLRQSASLDQVAGGWGVSSDRVRAVEDRLEALAASPPDADARARVSRLRDVVRASREQLQQLMTSGTPQAIPRVLSLVSSELESALATPPRPPA